MSKQIYVQAQADHIASLFRGSPLAAIEELVWNALDADAHEVRVDVITNPLQGIEAIRVADDGTGIDILRADSTFGSLGGSWKRTETQTPSTRRTLHGRHGCGRFRAFVLGCLAEWRTTVRIGGEMLSYRISGSADNPGVFDLDSSSTGPATGTEVYITNVRPASISLMDAGETVQSLAAKFALYLKSYPDVRIYFNGLPVTPIIVQKSVSDYTLAMENGAEAKLAVIEWKRRFVGSGRLVFSGPDGFQLHEQPTGVRAGAERSYTAYLISPRFPALHAENALVMDELNPEVRMYLEAARKALRAHFLAQGEAKSDFDLEWEERIAALTRDERQALLKILRQSLRTRSPKKPSAPRQ